MQSPYMSTKEVAELFRRKPETIHNWNSRDRRTGQKHMKSFPDPVFRGFYLREEIEQFGKLQRNDQPASILTSSSAHA